MGVIKKTDTKLGLFQSPSEESLHIPQSSEDDRSIVSQDDYDSIPLHGPQRNRNRMPVPMFFINTRKRLGKKKMRHQEDVIHLMTLVEEEELLGEVTIHDLIPDTSAWSFSKIFIDKSACQAWNDFINSSEEVQDHILQENVRISKCKRITTSDKQLTGEEAFMNIKTGIRNKLKRSPVPQGMVDYMEKNLVEFFTQDSSKTYVSASISSFERLLLHAISQYHRLISHSIDSELEKKRFVRVYNPLDGEFQLPTLLLGEFLENRRKSNELTPATNSKATSQINGI